MLCPSPDGGEETFILCRRRDRLEKEKAIFARFKSRIEEGGPSQLPEKKAVGG